MDRRRISQNGWLDRGVSNFHRNRCAETVFQPCDAGAFEFLGFTGVTREVREWISNDQNRFRFHRDFQELSQTLGGIFPFGNGWLLVPNPKKRPAGQNDDGDYYN